MESLKRLRFTSCLCHKVFLIVLVSEFVSCGVFVEDRPCGALYSGENFQGDVFHMKDYDQAANLKKDFRATVGGWWNTNSIRVEENCVMSICSETYFQGTCNPLPAGDYLAAKIPFPVRSTNCVCSRECKCQNVYIPKNNLTCGRAYLQGGCNSCDTKYIQLYCRGNVMVATPKYKDNFGSLVIRSGCKLTIYSDLRWKGKSQELENPITEDYTGVIGSYKFSCEDDKFVAPPLQVTCTSLTREGFRVSLGEAFLVNSPFNGEEGLLSQLHFNHELSTHAAIKAALNSLRSGRSGRNVYIVLIGASTPTVIGIPECPEVKSKIGECHLSLELDDLEISNVELRIIHVPVATGTLDTVNDDAKWALSLEEYLLNHEDLKEAIPNAVIIHHANIADNTLSDKRSPFQRKIAVVNALRKQLFDETYSNVIFLIEKLSTLPSPHRRNPEHKYDEFETAVREACSFPKPINIIFGDLPSRIKINGYWKMLSEEYLPRNLQERLVLISEKCGDLLGKSVFKAAFPEEKVRTLMTRKIPGDEIADDLARLEGYYEALSNPVPITPLIPSNEINPLSFEKKLKIFESYFAPPKKNESKTCGLEDVVQQLEAKILEERQSAEERHFQMESEFKGQIQDLNLKLVEEKNAREECRHKLHSGHTPEKIELVAKCHRHQWLPLTSITESYTHIMHNFGLVDARGRRMYVCRVKMETGALRVGSFTFEEGFCRVWFKTLVLARDEAEVLTIPGQLTEYETAGNGTWYSFQYDLMNSNHIPESVYSDNLLPVGAGDSSVKNQNKFVAVAAFSTETDCGFKIVDAIGTAALAPVRGAQFAGNGKPLKAVEFRVLVCARSKVAAVKY